MPRTKVTVFLALLLFTALSLLPLAAQTAPATAEAIGQANLRAAPSLDAELLGEIRAGTRYPVNGRSALYPWLLLGDPTSLQPIGWVYQDLVNVQGDLSSVPFTEQSVDPNARPALPTATLTAAGVSPITATTGQATPTLTLTPTLNAAVTGTLSGTVNVRSGPGVEYPRVHEGRAGDTFEVLGYHTQFPWVQVRYAPEPGGIGWIQVDLLEIQGDIYTLPGLSQSVFPTPTLTPTPQIIQQSVVFGGAAPVPLSAGFSALGMQLWTLVLNAQFEPGTSRLGALFLMDLQTGEAITFGNNVAFSGTSINKIAVMTALYQRLDLPPDDPTAVTLANMMVCSENTATNRVLEIIGDGDMYRGGTNTTAMLRQLGLQNTFILTPFETPPIALPPPTFIIERPITRVDQGRAQPDPYNQLTVDEMGWLLANLYQCAYNDSGALLDNFDAAFDGRECRQMLHLMSGNRIGALLEAGVPPGTRVAHKHGWINDTHGDAGIVFSPGGDYVLAVVLHDSRGANPWLNFEESFPLVAEVNRTVYNYFNPTAPYDSIATTPVPEQCIPPGQLIVDLTAGVFNE